MAIKKLRERLALAAQAIEPSVELQVPNPDAGEDMAAKMAAGAVAAQALLDDRNRAYKENELLRRELSQFRNAYSVLDDEKKYWRIQAQNWMHSNGELLGAIKQLFTVIEGFRSTMENTATNLSGIVCAAHAVNDQMPKPQTMQPRFEYPADASGEVLLSQVATGDSAPEPTQEELQTLAARLNGIS